MICITVLWFFCLSCLFGLSTSNENKTELGFRITGGRSTIIEYFPYMLSIEYAVYQDFRHFCGASIIGNVWALTAAHCVYGKSAYYLQIRAGSTFRERGGTVHKVAQYIIHPNYNSISLDCDIAVIRVAQQFRFSNTVQPVPIARFEPVLGTEAVVCGWGQQGGALPEPYQLRQVSVFVFNRYDCNWYFNPNSPIQVTRRNICASVPSHYKGFCAGDSGGPLVAAGQQIGIVSWTVNQKCEFYPGVYTNVASFYLWIRETTNI